MDELRMEISLDACIIRGPQGPEGPQGPQGESGVDGDTPYIEGDETNGYFWYIRGENTGVPANGRKGDKGDKGDTGERGDPFTYADFTRDQLLLLKGPAGDAGPAGPQGPEGPQGPQGESGVAVPLSGFFTLSVDENGDLWCWPSGEGDAPNLSYDEKTGDLYFITGE